MAVAKGRQFWKGTSAEDLAEYLAAFSAAREEPVAEVVPLACAGCGGRTFRLEVDDDEGFARRSCTGCGVTHVMLDSGEFEDDAEPGEAACPCGGEEFELTAGFATRLDGEVRWVFVAGRCVSDGTLGVFTDWSIDYSPSRHLLTSA